MGLLQYDFSCFGRPVRQVPYHEIYAAGQLGQEAGRGLLAQCVAGYVQSGHIVEAHFGNGYGCAESEGASRGVVPRGEALVAARCRDGCRAVYDVLQIHLQVGVVVRQVISVGVVDTFLGLPFVGHTVVIGIGGSLCRGQRAGGRGEHVGVAAAEVRALPVARLRGGAAGDGEERHAAGRAERGGCGEERAREDPCASGAAAACVSGAAEGDSGTARGGQEAV